jgi:hypothetical protein
MVPAQVSNQGQAARNSGRGLRHLPAGLVQALLERLDD